MFVWYKKKNHKIHLVFRTFTSFILVLLKNVKWQQKSFRVGRVKRVKQGFSGWPDGSQQFLAFMPRSGLFKSKTFFFSVFLSPTPAGRLKSFRQSMQFWLLSSFYITTRQRSWKTPWRLARLANIFWWTIYDNFEHSWRTKVQIFTDEMHWRFHHGIMEVTCIVQHNEELCPNIQQAVFDGSVALRLR